ncbi:MAG TPA: rod-binding protein [Sphingomonas sp.]|nr:rod-binding protein [Sphingomonas sp.]
MKTAKDFESVFIGQMTKIMMETAAPQDGTFSGGHGEEMFRGVMAEQLGGAIVARGGLGLTPVVLDQIARMQGDANVR